MKAKRSKEERSLDCVVYTANGKKTETVPLDSKVFDGVVNRPLLHQVVTMYQANQRSGSASTKTKGEVRGGGKKPWRQKGTGRARTGSIRNPLWRGGGIIFGPRPRSFYYSVPQKIKRLALKSSLNSKFLDGNMVIVESLDLEKPKTKSLCSILESLGINEGASVIAVMEKIDNNLKLASRNIPGFSLKAGGNFNAFDILQHKKLIIQKSALARLVRTLK